MIPLHRYASIAVWLIATPFASLFAQEPDQGPAAAAVVKAPPKQAARYLRVTRGQQRQPQALECSIIQYRGQHEGKPVVVDLVGAVHIAERSYYEELNRRFRGYDAVLYELVASEEARVPQRGRNTSNPVGGLQVGLKSMLGLDFQLDRIDYTADNLIHADMSPEEFSKSMSDRGESILQMVFRMMGQNIAQQSKDPTSNTDVDLLFAFFAKDRKYRLRRVMAQQFESMEGQLDALGGKEGSTLITERNKKALAVLREQLDTGKRRLAIFYGAGHLKDMEQRLQDEFRLKPAGIEWLEAWQLAEQQAPAP